MEVIQLGGHEVTSVVGELSDVFPTRTLAQIDGIAVHHDAAFFPDEADRNFNGTTVDEERARIDVVHQMHTGTNGWGGIAYHVYVFPSGRVWLVGALTTIRAHVAHQNTHLVGIVLAGDFTSRRPALGAVLGLANAIDAVNRAVGRALPYRGHRDWVAPEHKPEWATACPGDFYQNWIGDPARIIQRGIEAETARQAREAIFNALFPNLRAGNVQALHDQIHYLTGSNC